MTMKQKIYELLEDGQPHPREDLIKASGCKPGTLCFLLSTMRKSLDGDVEIICQLIGRKLHYRMIRVYENGLAKYKT